MSLRTDRVASLIKEEVGTYFAREYRDSRYGFITVTDVQVTPDLQIARIYYTTMGDERARERTAQALQRALPFIRRSIGSRVRLRRVPEVEFIFDESVEKLERIERLIQEIHSKDTARAQAATDEDDE